MKQTFLFTLFSLLLFFASNAQGVVTGTLTEEETGQPMGYCTVALLSAEDSSLITGGMSVDDGSFRIETDYAGAFLVRATFLGFKPVFGGPFTLAKGDVVNAGSYAMVPDGELVEEVQVTGKRSSVRYEVDKKVVSVDKQVAATGGTAIDVLENVPSIQVGASGDVQLRGSSNLSVFINGRPSVLSANDALRTIPAGEIKEIEIITNPSARYDAEGTGGIVNIILKEERKKGLRGAFTARGGLWNTYGGDGTLSYNREKVTVTLGGNYDRRTSPSTYTSRNTTTIGDSVVTTENDGTKERWFITWQTRAGITYRPAKGHSIQAKYAFGKWSMFNDDFLSYTVTDKTAGLLEAFDNDNNTQRGSYYHNAELDYKWEIKPNQTLKLYGSFAPRDFDEEIENRRFAGDETFVGGTLSTESGPGRRWRFNADYSWDVNDSTTIELGFLQELNRSSESSRFYDFDNVGEGVIENEEFRLDVDYRRDVRAFYGQYKTKWRAFGFQSGVRVERTDRTIDFDRFSPVEIDRLDFFPSLYASYRVNEDNRLRAGYSRRINRPRGWQFEPNPVFTDANTILVGNPEILPEYIDVFELSYLRYLKKGNSFNAELYYRRENNAIEYIRTPFSLDIIQQSPVNVGTSHFAGLETQFSYSPFSWWDQDWIANVFYNNLQSEVEGFEGGRSNVSYTFRLNQFFKPAKNTRFQLNMAYRGPQVTAQGENVGYFSLDIGFRQEFLNKALVLAVRGTDLANTVVRETVIDEEQFFFTRTNDPRSPGLILSLTYTLNNYRPSREQSMGGGDL